MLDDERALILIEEAERHTPFCPCGLPTIPVGHAGGVWLECSGLAGGPSRLAWLRPLLEPHVRRLVVDLGPGVLAA
ncbi:MAG TPA: hypothetical protein VF763_03800 [Candidatus Limnocylindrales bacterium]